MFYIPDRLDEGFGMNRSAVDALKEKGVSLIVTVDNGTSALPEIDYANSLGIDVIVTDHHQPGRTLPDAVAVVNPHRMEYQGFKQLCGAGVALKLAAALDGGSYDGVLEDFSPLAAIGTVGDVVSLTGENRMLVQKGMEMLPMTERPGLRALMELAGLTGDLTASKIAFGLCPRINAAGRMGNAYLAAEMLLCEDEERASELAAELDGLNQQRRAQEDEILAAITPQLDADPSLLLDRVLVVAAEGLNHGVVGIVASRLVGLYGKPVFVMSIEGDYAIGSARSLGNFSLFKAISSCANLCEKFGGHTLAAGLTLKKENLPAFRQAVNRYAAETADRMPVPQLTIDRSLKGGDLSLEAVEALSYLEPYGEGNPQPLFLMKNCFIEGITPLSGGKHIKLKVKFDGRSVFVLCFRVTPEQFVYPVDSCVDLLVNLEMNVFRDTRSISIRMKDIRPAGFEEKKSLNAQYYYEKLRRDEPVERKIAAIAVPTVPELRGLYRLLLQRKSVHADALYMQDVAEKMNYCKYRISLDIFREVGLIRLPGDLSNVEVLPVEGKVNLEASEILQKLRKKVNNEK
jgi:single-stranded-DNA-specific exonuclease